MALVLRKAVLPKNVSLLKCFKGRPLATAANKKNPAALSTAVPSRSLRDKTRMLRMGTSKIEKMKQVPSVGAGPGQSRNAIRFCASCPDVPTNLTRSNASPRHLSPPTRPICHDSPLSRNTFALFAHRTGSSPCFVPTNEFHTSNMYGYAKACSCPCGPCGGCGCGCNCLPPPCNQPPKCLQYMTGYYYYPYGFWFCGPYHVTGTCTPVGPCSPCGSCPCPCAKCCACLSPVAAAVVGGTQPQPQPRQPASSQQMPSRPLPAAQNENIKYPLPTQESVQQCNSASRNSGISKFFPFNPAPSADPIRRLPHSSVLMCPYSTATTKPVTPTSNNTPFPENKPVYCTPFNQQPKTNFSTRPRQSLSNNYPKSKKTPQNSFTRSYSDYDKRTETRSPIYHKRSKKFLCEVCPPLENPRGLQSPEQRDRPDVHPGTFQYTNIPNYRSPYPPQPCSEANFRAYDV